jgi:hypothetical protein
MAVTNARTEAQEADSQQEQASRSAANDNAQTPRAGPSRAQAPIATLEQWNYHSLQDSRQRKKKLPFLTREPKQSTTSDLWATAFSRPTSHPGGVRHPRIYILIREHHQAVPSSQRSTPSRLAVNPPEVSAQKDTQPAQPPPSSQVGPARQERRTNRTALYADYRRDGAGRSAARGN